MRRLSMSSGSTRPPRIGGPRVAAPPRLSNPNYDRSVVMRPPRLNLLPTRDYAKATPEVPNQNPLGVKGGAGFGDTGLDNGPL